MPTPTTAFADAAAKYGDVDPHDIEAVWIWFRDELPKLPADVVEQVFQDLLTQDGSHPQREIVPVYPDRVPIPSLDASPPVMAPILAERWRALLRRLAANLRARGRHG